MGSHNISKSVSISRFFFANLMSEQPQGISVNNSQEVCYWRPAQTFDICDTPPSCESSTCVLYEDFLTDQQPSDPGLQAGRKVFAYVFCEPTGDCACNSREPQPVFIWQAGSCTPNPTPTPTPTPTPMPTPTPTPWECPEPGGCYCPCYEIVGCIQCGGYDGCQCTNMNPRSPVFN